MLYCGFKQILDSCLVLVQPDFKINEVLNNHYNCVGEGGGVPLNVDVWVILGSH